MRNRDRDRYSNYTTTTNCVNNVCTTSQSPGEYPHQQQNPKGLGTGGKVLLGGFGILWLAVAIAVPISIVYIAVKMSRQP